MGKLKLQFRVARYYKNDRNQNAIKHNIYLQGNYNKSREHLFRYLLVETIMKIFGALLRLDPGLRCGGCRGTVTTTVGGAIVEIMIMVCRYEELLIVRRGTLRS